MPSERFFKLDDDKQQRIMDASIDEFLRSGYTDASINQIIKEAEISRGSFYTYFTDKSELFAHIFNKMKLLAKKEIIRYLKKCDGNLFEACRCLMQRGLSLRPAHADRMTQLFCRLLSKKDILEHISYVGVGDGHGDPVLNEMVQEMYDNLDDMKDCISRDNFTPVVDMLMTISIKALTTASGSNKDYSVEILYKQYDIIERGIRGGALK